MEDEKKCPYCSSKYIAFEWTEDLFDADLKCNACIVRNRCMECKQTFNEKHIPVY